MKDEFDDDDDWPSLLPARASTTSYIVAYDPPHVAKIETALPSSSLSLMSFSSSSPNDEDEELDDDDDDECT